MLPLKVFLCHSSDDKVAVRDLYHRLSADGYSPWLDEEDLLPGQEWEDEIPKAVQMSDIVIVCLSERSVSKTGYVQKEIKFALDVADQQPQGTMFIIPLKLEPCDVPGRLVRWHWVNLFEEKGYEKLRRSLLHRATGSLLAHASLAGLTQQIDESRKTSADGGDDVLAHPVISSTGVSDKSPADQLRNPTPAKSESHASNEIERKWPGKVLKAYRSVSRIASWLSGIVGLGLLLLVIFGNIPGARVSLVRLGLALTAFLFSLFFIGGILLKARSSGLAIGGIVGFTLFALVRFAYPAPGLTAVLLPTPTPTPVAAVGANPEASASPRATPPASASPSPSPRTARKFPQKPMEGNSFFNKAKRSLRKMKVFEE